MKKVLLASTALVFAGGMAMADVEVSGDGRMGIQKDFGTDDIGFTSRVRFSFTGSGETDGGLTFGGSLASDDSGDDGTSGSVFAEGAFGRISMGDVDSAAEAAVGGLSGIGLTDPTTGIAYLLNNETPAVLYEGSFGDATVYLGAENPAAGDGVSAGVSYGFGSYTIAVGYEDDGSNDHIIAGLSAGFGDATVKVVYGDSDGLTDGDQLGVSLDYVFGATTLSAVYVDNNSDGDEWGVGVSYDLGGGAALKAGYIDSDIQGDDYWDFGMSMSF